MIVGIITARMGSSRFPGKPLAKIHGMPMLGHVYYRSKMSKALDDVYIAACEGDREIADYAASIGAKSVIGVVPGAVGATAEAAEKIEKSEGVRIDYAAVIQGDEPMLMPEMIDELVAPAVQDKNLKAVNLIQKPADEDEFISPNTVKAVLDIRGNIIYLSREAIPSRKKYAGEVPRWKQLGMILLSRELLAEYNKMTKSPLEAIESVDMLRFIENGIKIKAVPTEHKTHSVDTEDDLKAVFELMKEDILIKKYLN